MGAVKDIAESLAAVFKGARRDSRLWFWLSVAALLLLIADHYDLIRLGSLHPGARTWIVVALVVLVCLWLSTFSIERHVGNAVIASRAATKRWYWRLWTSRRVNKQALTVLPRLLATPCAERRLLLYLWAVNRKPLFNQALRASEFEAARSLLDLGLLHQTTSGPYQYTFVHPKVAAALKTLSPIIDDVDTEIGKLRERGRA
jgi:uncharacterized membrane protein